MRYLIFLILAGFTGVTAWGADFDDCSADGCE